MKALRHPDTVGAMAYASNDALFLTDDQRSEMWMVPAGGTALQRAEHAPDAVTVAASGGVLVASRGTRSLAVSADGVAWRAVEPGRRFSAVASPSSP